DYPRHRVTRDLPLTFYPGVAALVPAASGLPDDVRVTPLVQSGPRARLAGHDDDPGVRSLLVLAQRDVDAAEPATATLKQVPLGQAALTRAALMVSGDSDFATNRYFATLGNGTLFTRSIAFLA